jgi:hypothetical protein
MGTRGALSLGVKRSGRKADHSPPSSAEVKEWVELYLHSIIRLHDAVLIKARGQLYLYLLPFTPHHSTPFRQNLHTQRQWVPLRLSRRWRGKLAEWPHRNGKFSLDIKEDESGATRFSRGVLKTAHLVVAVTVLQMHAICVKWTPFLLIYFRFSTMELLSISIRHNFKYSILYLIKHSGIYISPTIILACSFSIFMARDFYGGRYLGHFLRLLQRHLPGKINFRGVRLQIFGFQLLDPINGKFLL